jgi:hypothetical protein
MADYDKELINREVLEVCDYYLTHRKRDGKRSTYSCPGCGSRDFEVEPVRGYAGCFDAACEVPTATDALGIIAYFEGRELRGEGFVACLKKGYEILGVADPEDQDERRSPGSSKTASAHQQPSYEHQGNTHEISPSVTSPSSTVLSQTDLSRADTADKGHSESTAGSFAYGVSAEAQHSRSWGPAGAGANAEPTTGAERPIQAWFEDADGSRVAVDAVLVEDPEEKVFHGQSRKEASAAPEYGRDEPKPDAEEEKEIAHAVYEYLLSLCPLEERDREFLRGRGLDTETIRTGRYGSSSRPRCNYILNKLDERFPDRELLGVPGFYRTDSGGLRFSLYGDYVLIPYHDRDGYIRTVEGRFTGKEMSERDKKYKAPMNSGVHLYVHPAYKPDEVVAFCEGAVGAMVAARYGVPVAAIKGFRNYRQPPTERHEEYSVLPELAGVNLADKEVVYIPDIDVKPDSYEAVMEAVPKACQWLIERQGGVAKVAMLPEKATDLDQWLLSLDESERASSLAKLLREARPVEEWAAQYLHAPQGSEDRSRSTKEGSQDKQQQLTGDSRVEDEQLLEEQSRQDTRIESRETPQQGTRDYEEVGQDYEEVGEKEENQEVTQADTQGVTERGAEVGEDYEEIGGEDTQEHDAVGDQDQDDGSKTDGGVGAGEREGADDRGHGQKTGQERTVSGRNRSEAGDDDTREVEGKTTAANDPALGTESTSESSAASPSSQRRAQPAPVGREGEKVLVALAYVVAAISICVIARFVLFDGGLGWTASTVAGAVVAAWLTVGLVKLRRWRTRRRLERHVRGGDV